MKKQDVSCLEADSFIEDVFAINFLRDIARIDMAITNRWVYLTSDRLAYIYYNTMYTWDKAAQIERAQAEKINQVQTIPNPLHRGLYISVHPSGNIGYGY